MDEAKAKPGERTPVDEAQREKESRKISSHLVGKSLIHRWVGLW